MCHTEALNTAIDIVGTRLSRGEADELLAELNQGREVVSDFCRQQAAIMFALLTGQLDGPLRPEEGLRSLSTEEGPLAVLEETWLQGFLAGLVLSDSPIPTLSFLELAECSRTRDTLSKEHGIRTFWRQLGVDPDAIESICSDHGERQLERLRRAPSLMQRFTSKEATGLASLLQDGIALALISLDFVARNAPSSGEGIRASDDIPPEEL